MKIAILIHHPSIYIHKRFSEVGKERGHDIRFINISNCYMNISATHPAVYYKSSEPIESVDAIIPRISPIRTFYGTAVLRQLEIMGIYTLNSSLSITWCRDKFRMLQLLTRKHIPLPITGVADSPEESEKLIDVVGGTPLIVRLLEGTEGRGTIFAETHQAAVSVINAFKQLKTNILVQEYIQEANGSDIRCMVVGHKVIASMQRNAPEAGGPHSHHPLRSSLPIKITAEEKKMAIKATKAMKLNFASVDLIRSNRGPLVLDVDSSPNIEILEKVTEVDIISALMQFIEENAKKPD